MKIKRVVPHPHYNLGIAHDNDVALFQVSSEYYIHIVYIFFIIWKLLSIQIISNYILTTLLLQLEHRVEFHDHLRPVCLPKAETDLKPGTNCTVIGWGKKEDNESKFFSFT